MSHRPTYRRGTRATCPACGRSVAVTKTGKLRAHGYDPRTFRNCLGSTRKAMMFAVEHEHERGLVHQHEGDEVDHWHIVARTLPDGGFALAWGPQTGDDPYGDADRNSGWMVDKPT